MVTARVVSSTEERIARIGESLTAVERRLVSLEDVTQLERLNSIYGYYLAHIEWDNFTGLFTSDGEIEIAMRGVYVGQPRIRQSMNFYGLVTDPQFGLQHNHMQFQPVITLAPDGESAKMRSRAFSIMGNYERSAQWMGGVYENDYVKEDGVWKLKRDQQLNTYFVSYAAGWRDAQPRPPPGMSQTVPPDLLPTKPFELYPSAYLPPFHYPHPVTGQRVEWTPPGPAQ